jgi:hypothetical protein
MFVQYSRTSGPDCAETIAQVMDACMSLPPNSRLWKVEGIPVAEIRCDHQGWEALPFDTPSPYPFSRFALISRASNHDSECVMY